MASTVSTAVTVILRGPYRKLGMMPCGGPSVTKDGSRHLRTQPWMLLPFAPCVTLASPVPSLAGACYL